jgi:hypothetical protein
LVVKAVKMFREVLGSQRRNKDFETLKPLSCSARLDPTYLKDKDKNVHRLAVAFPLSPPSKQASQQPQCHFCLLRNVAILYLCCFLHSLTLAKLFLSCIIIFLDGIEQQNVPVEAI